MGSSAAERSTRCRSRSSTSARRTGSAFPVSAWVTGTIFLIAGLFLRYHRVGRAIYAIGGNPEAARAAGIKVDRIRIGVFIVAGMLAAVAGLMTSGQVVAVTANQGNNLIFTVFAAAVIGGIELEGGRGRMFGALTGVVLLGLVQNILVLSQITSTFWIDAANGAIILIALALARLDRDRTGSDRAARRQGLHRHRSRVGHRPRERAALRRGGCEARRRRCRRRRGARHGRGDRRRRSRRARRRRGRGRRRRGGGGDGRALRQDRRPLQQRRDQRRRRPRGDDPRCCGSA